MSSRLTTKFPRIALGTDKVSGSECVEYIQRGLAAGYRMIDTAAVYDNEEAIGVAVRLSGVPRRQVFVTTKITAGFKKNPATRREAIRLAQMSCERLGLDYVDAVLIHHPGDDARDAGAAMCRRITWKGLEELVRAGWVRQIGVSNFGAAHIRENQQFARIMPSVNQLELHPWFQQREAVDVCHEAGIPLQAYSAIARNSHCDDVKLQQLAKKYKMSTVQLLLCYSLQKGYTPIIRATNPEHLEPNIQVQEGTISAEHMSMLDSWDMCEDGSLFSWVRNSG